MEIKFICNVNNYDGYELTQSCKSWPTLPVDEKMGVLSGYRILRNFNGLKNFLQTHKTELEALGVYDLASLMQATETKDDFSVDLYNVIERPPHKEFFVEGERNFWIGFALSQMNFHSLAKIYFEKSHHIYQKLSFHSLEWRSLFNLSICFFKEKNMSLYEKSIEDLHARYLQLSPLCQMRFARFLIWLYSYQGNSFRLQELTTYIHDNFLDNNIPQNNEIIKYIIYLSIKTNNKNLLLRGMEYINDGCDKNICQEMLQISQAAHPHKELKKLLAKWISLYNPMDRFHLVELLLEKYFTDITDPLLLVKIYEQTINFPRLFINYILTPRDLNEFGLIAYKKANKKHLFSKLYNQVQASASPYLLANINKKLKNLDKIIQSKKITFDCNHEILTIDEQSISLKRHKSLKIFFYTLLQQKHSILSHLSEKIYGPKEPEHKQRIIALIHRARRLLSPHNIILHNSQDIWIAADFHVQVLGQLHSKQKGRRKDILKYARQHREFRLIDLAKSIDSPKRSLQRDVRMLLEAGQLQKIGRGPASKYKIT